MPILGGFQHRELQQGITGGGGGGASASGSGSITRKSGSSRETGQASGTSSSEFRRGSYASSIPLYELEKLLGEFDINQLISESNMRARETSRDAVDSLFRDYRESSLPQIFSGVAGAGAFNSSTSQLMANDAYGRTVSSAAELTLGLANTYVNQAMATRQQRLDQFASLLGYNIQSSGKDSASEQSSFSNQSRYKEKTTNVTASMGFSDRRLKEDVVQVGTYETLGVPMYEFRYIGKPEVWRGLMAQDLLGTPHEHAVGTTENGMYWVDYAALGITMDLVTGE